MVLKNLIIWSINGNKVNTKEFNTYKIFENYLNKSVDYDGTDMIEKSIKNDIKIYKKKTLYR